MDFNATGTIIIDAALTVHKQLGPGLLESAYENCLIAELKERGLVVDSQVPLPLIYNDKHLGTGYRADLRINHCVIVEIKAVDALNDVHVAQMITYLKLSKCRLGFLLNFNVVRLKQGIKRIIV
jgi:GxxExxY protein